MHEIFINLKRFDVPKEMGGLCLTADPQAWIEDIIDQTVKLGLGKLDDVSVAYTLPDALVLPAMARWDPRWSNWAPSEAISLCCSAQPVPGSSNT